MRPEQDAAPHRDSAPHRERPVRNGQTNPYVLLRLKCYHSPRPKVANQLSTDIPNQGLSQFQVCNYTVFGIP